MNLQAYTRTKRRQDRWRGCVKLRIRNRKITCVLEVQLPEAHVAPWPDLAVAVFWGTHNREMGSQRKAV